MRTPRRSRSLAFAVTLVVAAAACGDDGDDGDAGGEVELTSEEHAYADAWASVLADDEEGFAVSADDAECMAAAMMAEIGTEPFQEADVAPEDIEATEENDSPGEVLGAGVVSDAQADAILDRWAGCTDIAATLADAAVGEFDLDEQGRTCVADGLREDDLAREGLKPSFTSDNDEPPAEVLSALVELVDQCAGAEGQSVVIDGIAESLMADGSLDEEQATCLAEAMVDSIGLDRLIELGAGGGELEAADPETQQEVTRAILDASEACDIPLGQLGGG